MPGQGSRREGKHLLSYSSRESSEYSGQPLLLVQVRAGGVTYGYTPNDVESSHLGVTYLRLPGLDVDAVRQGADFADSQNDIQFTVPRDTPFAQLFTGILPASTPEVSIFSRHQGDSETVAHWHGKVVALDFRGNTAEVRCASELSLLKAMGLRYTYSRRCQHQLYDPETCRVNPNDFDDFGVVTTITGSVIQIPVAANKADGYYTAGMVKRTNTGEFRFITNHAGQNLTLYAPFAGLAVNEPVQIFAGCDHTIATCDGKFGNSANCGCWPAVPLRNPVTQKIA
jgi:uncharacterized phage protein (TIGR02218 family)